MPAGDRKARFEPPPWERAAFEEFRRQEAEAALSSELDQMLRDTLRAAEDSPKRPGGTGSVAQGPSVDSGASQALPAGAVESLLEELRAEEPAMPRVRPIFGQAVAVMLAGGGAVLVVGGSRLFVVSRTGPAAASLLSGAASLAVLLIGLCLMAAGFVLFRKYQQ